MIFALPFPLFLLEVFLFVFFASRIGFLGTMGFYFLPSLLGLLLLSLQSRTALMRVQKIIAEGGNPGRRLLGTAANFMAGIFLVVPFVTTRLIALCLIVPGVRQIFLLAIHAWLTRKIVSGAARMSRGGFGAGPGFRAEFRRGPAGWEFSEDEGPRVERDATAIDVEPLEIDHSESKTRRDS
ncbi:MAG TPA: FxsA family protein [Pseudobdellovibrionaceae bacterium]|nr:FxsA family protein [Pseudobdellovibrionaceae bacterium]